MFTKIATAAAVLLCSFHANAPADARSRPDLPAPKAPIASSKEPLIVVISLRRQRLTVYDRNGTVTESPISSGNAENPTVTGIFSVIGKSVEHFSNLYDDAPMPYMQRLTWTGTAMHAGHLPGYPASHGCIRLPHGFSQRLFDMTSMNTRVIVSYGEVAPMPISHPKLISPLPVADDAIAMQPSPTGSQVAALGGNVGSIKPRRADEVPMTAAARARFAETQDLFDAIAPVDGVHAAKLEAFRATQKSLNLARLDLEALDERVKAANTMITRFERTREKLEAQLVGIGRRLDSARNDRALQSLIEAEEATEAKLFDLAKDLEGARDALAKADVPLGTHVYTAMGYRDGFAKLDWNVVTVPTRERDFDARNKQKLSSAAAAALDRVQIPDEALAAIAERIKPGSSIIISDETTSQYFGEGTDFTVATR
ncbi:MAG: L,D-transpeptidase family protein [Hyphomicrobiaceae bacterium]|nr:L,D-transpeptidase family protein [Hyphomicrobiaceae bacterium]